MNVSQAFVALVVEGDLSVGPLGPVEPVAPWAPLGPVLPAGRGYIISCEFDIVFGSDLSEGPLGPAVPVGPVGPVLPMGRIDIVSL